MKLRDFFTITYGEWYVYYRNSCTEWKKLETQKGYWYADPILLKYHDETYLFTEAFENKKQIGRIAVSKFVNGEFTIPHEIIRKPYHMSYPCVFEYNDNVYMIPESSQNRTLELYKAKDRELLNWEFIKVLAQDVNWVDTTVFKNKFNIYLITYIQDVDKYITEIYTLNMNNLSITRCCSFFSKENVYRPAGNIFECEGVYYRPVQYNINCYGEKMQILRVNVDDCDWKGTIVAEYTVETLGLKKVCKTHTYGKSENIEVVDALQNYKTLLAPYYVFRRKVHNLHYRIKKCENLYKRRKV